ncbi:MAG: hypothetical protein C4519_25945 [Desulfobacteraceae bacterium]|nr:MAG: hypothetical protein C4519_25945 [Desulfobacteraceae bacterium]
MNLVESAIEASQKAVVARSKEAGEEAQQPRGPVGLDIGTSNLVMAENKGKNVHTVKQVNAFFTIPYSKFTKKILVENDISFFEKDGQFYILGNSAESFATMFNTNTRRTMERGVLNATEVEGLTVLRALINTLLQSPQKPNEIICFSTPGEPTGKENSVVYHEEILKRFLSEIGFTPMSVNEGQAVVMSELADDNFSGIGISMGGGMCNVCLSYLSVPVTTFSIQKGGDYVDSMVAASVGESATKIKLLKEETLNLSRDPRTRVETALHIFYDELIVALLQNLQRVLTTADKLPKVSKPVPIVLAGGSVKPKGCRERFEKMLRKISLPVEISEVRVSEDPLNTIAKGALVMALAEEI